MSWPEFVNAAKRVSPAAWIGRKARPVQPTPAVPDPWAAHLKDMARQREEEARREKERRDVWKGA